MAGLQLEWQRAKGGAGAPTPSPPAAVVRPLVVLLPWVWSEPQYVNKYTALCHQAGWDVLVARWPMLALWFPPWSRSLAASLLTALGGELAARGQRPVVFWSFSGAAKGIYASLLSLLASPKRLKPPAAAATACVLRCAVGQIYDSGPVDFSSDMGRKLLSPNSSTADNSIDAPQQSSTSSANSSNAAATALAFAARSAAAVAVSSGVDVSAGLLDFFLMEVFDADRDAMWSSLTNSPVWGPVLMLYSRSDDLADAAQIADLAAALKHRGRPVLEQVWHDSPHVGHLRAHPQAYSEAVSFLLSQALQEWSARNSRRWEGRDWTQSWQQQQQQPLQEQASTGARPAIGSRTVTAAETVSSNYARSQLQQQQEQEEKGEGRQCSSNGDGWEQQQQQQQQLVLQPTKGFTASRRRWPARAHNSNAGSNGDGNGGSHSSRQAPTLVRTGTSGTSSGSSSSSGELPAALSGRPAIGAAAADAVRRSGVLAQQLAPWLLASQMAFDGSSASSGASPAPAADVPHPAASLSSTHAAAASHSGGAVVRISSWSATASAVAAAMSEGAGGPEPLCADATLLSHSLRCLARSYLISGTVGVSGAPSTQAVAATQQQAQQQQQQQPFMRRIVNRLRSRL